MYFIGIDPSTSSTGYAVINEKKELIDYGKIKGSADDPKSFAQLYSSLFDLFTKYPPTSVYCETQFIGVNRATSIKLIRPTGVVLAVVGNWNTQFNFSAPSSWRKLFQGEGKWSKKDTYTFVKERYPDILGSFTKDNDISDAIGIANACLITYQKEGVEHANAN